MTPQQVVQKFKDDAVKIVDFRFVDLFGQWQHTSRVASRVDEDILKEGIGFDGSSIRGFQSIEASDMLLMPDCSSYFIDPFFEHKTAVIICDIMDPITHEMYAKDPRHIAQKATKYLSQTGIADTAYFGPEAEFFLFDDVRFDTTANQSYYAIDSREGAWNTGLDEVEGNLAYKTKHKGGYFPCPPADTFQDIRSEMVLEMEKAGIEVEIHHHEVATAGQAEIDIKYNTLLASADSIIKYKYIVKNTARKHGFTATFMPKPLFGDNGNGMHTHQSIWKNGKNVFYAPGNYADLSDNARYYIGGLLKHAAAILAFAAPSSNSYKRLVPGFEAPVNLLYSSRNRSACIRIPTYSPSEGAKRLEFRCPDPSANPYLAFSAMLMAGLDGIENKIEPPPPLDKDLYDLEPEVKANIAQTPASIAEALNALEEDHEFLLKGDVFTQDVIDTWLDMKREEEVDELSLRPHPYEFYLTFDC
ncbi:MAG: type I glutamate--ammonia ligase [Nitrospinae bacterium]|nr:type I glutamate--ammonia ligase [Nitrospinota bacterium]